MRVANLVLSLLCVAAPALAQKVYRCGADGREFSQIPCKDAQTLEVSDGRTDWQREQAKANIKRAEKLATSMQRERKAREATAQGAAGFHPAKPASAPASTPTEKKPKRYITPQTGDERKQT